MIVVIRKTEKPERERAPGPRGHAAAIVALVALAVAAGALFWTTRQPPQADAGLGLPHGVIVVAAAHSLQP